MGRYGSRDSLAVKTTWYFCRGPNTHMVVPNLTETPVLGDATHSSGSKGSEH